MENNYQANYLLLFDTGAVPMTNPTNLLRNRTTTQYGWPRNMLKIGTTIMIIPLNLCL